jgi:hypothetical protein
VPGRVRPFGQEPGWPGHQSGGKSPPSGQRRKTLCPWAGFTPGALNRPVPGPLMKKGREIGPGDLGPGRQSGPTPTWSKAADGGLQKMINSSKD